MSKTVHPQNRCEACGYTWYPRGKDLSSVCPRCKSGKVGRSGSGVLGGLGVIAVLLYFIFHGNTSSRIAEGVVPQPLASSATEPADAFDSTAVASVASMPAVTSAPRVAIPSVALPVAGRSNDMPPEPVVGTPSETASLPAMTEGPSVSSATVEAVGPRDRFFSDEEIWQMEDRAQYHGDDPIVRARLGLPSRETKKLMR